MTITGNLINGTTNILTELNNTKAILNNKANTADVSNTYALKFDLKSGWQDISNYYLKKRLINVTDCSRNEKPNLLPLLERK